ncbi:MAG: 4Fe-4S binding protein [Planctomycetota bacterium]
MKTDLLQYGFIRKILTSRRFIFIIRLAIVFLFILIIYAGLVGGIYRNVATVFTGIIWLTAISFLVLFLGKIWCLVCPWNTIAEWVQQKGFQRTEAARLAPDNDVSPAIFSLNLKYPRWWEKIYLPAWLLIFLVLLEYTAGITTNPRMTAYVALFILTAAVISAIIFRRKSFCRSACPVGVISGLYSLLSPLELRSKDKDVCRMCQSKDCINGNKHGKACPVFEYPGEMKVNTYCILCTECIHTCPRDNISLNLRSFGGDLNNQVNSKSESVSRLVPSAQIGRGGLSGAEEFLIMLLLGLITLHSFFTGSQGFYFTGLFTEKTGFNERWISVLLVLSVTFLTWVGIYLIRNLFKVKLIHLAVPLVLFYNLALVVKHFLGNFEKIGPALLDPFGWNWQFFGIAAVADNSLVSSSPGEFLQNYLPLILMTVGTLWSLYLVIKKSGLKLQKIILVVLALFLWYILNINFWHENL